MHGSIIPNSARALWQRVKISSFVAGTFCLALGHTSAQEPDKTNLSLKMTLEQKVGQLMVWSFKGTNFTPEMQTLLTKYQPGALIAFRSNIKTPEQVARLNSDLQRFAMAKTRLPLLLMVDQEGGLVTRIQSRLPAPSALALARMEDTAFVENYGRATGEMLRLLGFNVNLAPVLDISNPRRDTFIGNRTFGNDPVRVSDMAIAYARGLNNGGLIPTAKHFPGHGGTSQDSHQTTPRKNSSLEELQNHDLIPFDNFVTADFTKAIMMAHMALPNVDASGVPATYSSVLIHDQLRENLGYKGLVMTDDLEMAGAQVAGEIGERAVRAFLAGNDMLMLAGSPSHQKRAYEAMILAVKEGRISQERLDQSVQRIVDTKARLKAPLRLNVKAVAPALQKIDNFSREVFKHNYKMAALEAQKKWPEITSKTKVKVYSASYMFFKKFQTAFKGKAEFFELNPTSLDSARQAMSDDDEDVDFSVFFASGSRTAHWLNGLSPDQKGKLIVVNTNSPGEVDDQSAFMSVLNINSYFTDSGAWLAQTLKGSVDLRLPAGENPSQAGGDESDENQ